MPKTLDAHLKNVEEMAKIGQKSDDNFGDKKSIEEEKELIKQQLNEHLGTTDTPKQIKDVEIF